MHYSDCYELQHLALNAEGRDETPRYRELFRWFQEAVMWRATQMPAHLEAFFKNRERDCNAFGSVRSQE